MSKDKSQKREKPLAIAMPIVTIFLCVISIKMFNIWGGKLR